MSLEAVYGIINRVQSSDQRSQQGIAWVEGRFSDLHDSLQRPQSGSTGEALLAYTLSYIRLTADSLRWIEQNLSHCEQGSFGRTLFQTCLNYYLAPATPLLQNSGLPGLVLKTYQCARLLEECYENNRQLLTGQTANLQLMPANLLTHLLIGEPFANELDSASLEDFERIAPPDHFFELKLLPTSASELPDSNLEAIKTRWQDLLEDHGLQFSFLNSA